MVISKKTIIVQGFREGPTFFQGDPNANFYRTDITCDISRDNRTTLFISMLLTRGRSFVYR